MGFFRDLFSPLQPCDICQLGFEKPVAGLAATNDWRFHTQGLHVEFLVCQRCRGAIERLNLLNTFPLAVVLRLVAEGIILRPKPQAYLANPRWKVVWRHMLDLEGHVPRTSSEERQLFQDVEQKMMLRIASEVRTARELEEMFATHACKLCGKRGLPGEFECPDCEQPYV